MALGDASAVGTGPEMAQAQGGATLVDLFTNGTAIAQHPDWISSDGFHPNGLGYLAIATAFERASQRKA